MGDLSPIFRVSSGGVKCYNKYVKREEGMKHKENSQKGFSIVELIITVAIFTILAAGVLGSFLALSQSVKKAREKTVLSSLATNYLEIVRNMPYSQVGTLSGNPPGNLPDFTNAIVEDIEAFNYKIYYEVTYIDDPADGTIILGTDFEPNDYKQVKMSILNTATNQTTHFLTTVVPQGLEGLNNAGAILVKVFNAQGQPVEGAGIHIEHPTSSPTIILDRQSNADGQWVEVGLPAAINNYRIVVTKAGYSTDQTYPLTLENPNPINPDVTVVDGTVTEVVFQIDLLADLTILTQDSFCQPLSGVDVNVRGSRLIGSLPDIFKYDQNHISSAGQIVLGDIEWDTYTPTLLTNSLIVYGTSPIQKIDVLPGADQIFTMILGTNSTANSLLVVVKDGATGSALEGAAVHLRKGGSTPQDYYGVTGGSVWLQDDWTGGSGSENFSTSTPDRYFQDDGNIDINSVPTGVRLKKVTGRYLSSGWLESSTFDTGSSITNYTTLTWQPDSQVANTELKFQIASNNDGATWDYVGPDGTASTYYSVSGTSIAPVHDNDRYVRYKVFLSTVDDKKTPILTSLNVNYVSGCFTPGQTIFTDLTAGNNYELDVSLSGYLTEVEPSLNIVGNYLIEILLTPQ
ncbi:MAG: hypothetical protein COT92_03260 [Candidatus Doudnabacteria bacterium CG10_big_fil_rev_8_21_14_0_10_42_18]|uniref:Uncharacterized protein n=1 Tax=Candidatus Doudnabacteria bacterium CG10_big_fil_rev_8_21_14_0_10_42_18 TaxID=1974552 RepID=A0A2H0VCE7_9BACT|nr:MAG: hypothetical protein COT92_03260 [Candidatus Doudnabacteria bacterium CG10_big_fil_rev_8_21_14_0_10_42_18]